MVQTPDEYATLLQRLRDCDISLTEISLEGEDDLADLAAVLKNNSVVNKLTLQTCVLGEHENVLTTSIAAMSNLTALRLRQVKLTVNGARQLANSNSWPNLQVLDLADNPKLGPRGIKPVAERLAQAVNLQTLILSNCRMGHFGIKALTSIPSTLLHLDLSRNNMGNDGSWKLAEALHSLFNLKSLLLSHNQIGDDGASEIGRQIQFLENLSDLDMSDNDFGSVGASILGSTLGESRLVTLNLSNNRIDSEGAESLAQAIRQCRHLEELNLAGNRIDDDGAGAFVEHLDENQILVKLNLSDNVEISSARLRILEMLLKHRQKPNSPRRAAAAENGGPPAIEGVGSFESEESTQQQEQAVLAQGRQLLQSDLNTEPVEVSPNFVELFSSHLQTEKNALGHGAFGRLSKGRDGVMKRAYAIRRVALSESSPMEEARSKVVKELLSLRFSRHSNVLSLRAFAKDQDLYFFIYDVTERLSLYDCLVDSTKRKKLSWDVRLEIIRGIASAVGYLDGIRSSFHGDITPSNIFLNGENKAQLIDCGLSRLIATDRARFEKGDVVFGSRGYRCPRYERGSRKFTHESEVFSIGIVMAEILTGRLQNYEDSRKGCSIDFYYEYVVDKRRDLKKDLDPLASTGDATSIGTICKVALACLDGEPARRPGAATVAKVVGDLIK